MAVARELKRLLEQDAKLVLAARNIKVLSSLGWPTRMAEDFLAAWRAGNPKLPEVQLKKSDLKDECAALARIASQCDVAHPIGRFLNQTANSYIAAARMLEAVGTQAFTELSIALYGSPTEHLGKLTSLTMAEDFIQITSDFADAVGSEGVDVLAPELVAYELKKEADEFFSAHDVQVVVDPTLTAKAAAGAEKVRLRGQTLFSKADVDQLLQHELFVHSATMLNGRAQPWLKSLGLSSPRTTVTQEGLATFAELITATMDLTRLRRIALRIKGVHMALTGADFIEVFKFFLSSGQSEQESFQSAARVFRGGDVRGRHVFTKDVVYLKGLFSVHTFLRKAIELRKIDYPKWLFVGRLALGDVLLLEPFMDRRTSEELEKVDQVVAHGAAETEAALEALPKINGIPALVRPPLYMPRWVAHRERLAAYLSYALFANRLRLSDIKLEDFVSDLHLDS